MKDIVEGKVTRIVKFGLFVQIEEDLEGLVHISELSQEPVKRPSDIAKIGDELEVRIIDIDFDKRRMAFSIKQVENPEEAEEEEEKEPKKAKAEVKDKKTKAKKKESGKADKKVEASDKKDKEVKVKEKSTEAEDKESKKKRKIEEILQEMKDEADIG